VNGVGDDATSLSRAWYERAKAARKTPKLQRMKNNLFNVFHNKYRVPSNRTLWTTFKDFMEDLKGKGYTGGFLACNARATNEYRARDHVAYCVNIFYNPFLKNYFLSHGIEVREDEYALSEMIQWIWRSAIRDGKEIWAYIPSRRMRELLKGWLDELAASGRSQNERSEKCLTEQSVIGMEDAG
jgi:hypothetical protein